MKKKLLTCLFAGVLASSFLLVSCDDDDDDSMLPNAVDNNFVRQAAFGNVAEINFGQLALTKSNTDSITNFARMMIADHSLANSGLDSLETRFTYNLPDTLDAEHQAKRAQLVGLTGRRFDSAYIKGQVEDHIRTINLFQEEVNNGRAPEIRSYAQRLLPNLQMHLQMAQTIASRY